jgi:hypothetical protein
VLLLDERRKANFYTGKGIDYFNTYSLQHTKGVYEGWRRDIPGKRAFFLVRQSFAGEQRNALRLWSSDIECTLPTLKPGTAGHQRLCIGHPVLDIGHWRLPLRLEGPRLVEARV